MKPKVCIVKCSLNQIIGCISILIRENEKVEFLVNYSTMCSSHFGVPQKKKIDCGWYPTGFCKSIRIKDEEGNLDHTQRVHPMNQPLVMVDGVVVDEFERKQLLLNSIKQSTPN